MTKRTSPSSAPASDSDRRAQAAPRAEWVIIAVIVGAGIGLRVWRPDHMAVEHFDEGVYASNLFTPYSGNAYPFRHLYAPPFLPALLEGALVLSGGAAASVMWVNVIAGCAMIPSVWWVLRQWFGPLAGLTAAALAALSPIHIQYSRAALTDGLLCLWMLWGAYWAWRAILTGRASAIVTAGAFASLAWWTKYNGWLTLAVSGSGMAAWWLVPRLIPAGLATRNRLAARLKGGAKQDGDDAERNIPGPLVAVIRWGLMGVVAFAGWVPVLVGLQQFGGFAAVSANHAKYFVGLDGWINSFVRQAANLGHYHGWLTLVAVLLAGTAMWALSPLRKPRADDRREASLAGWMLAAWFIGLLVAVPLYWPYPRLTLPWVVAAWMIVGSLSATFLESLNHANGRGKLTASRWGAAVLLLMAAALVQGAANHQNRIDADRRGLQVIAAQILDRIAAEIDATGRDDVVVIRVLGAPGLFFHLSAMVNRQTSLPNDVLIVPAAGSGLPSLEGAANVRLYVVSVPEGEQAERRDDASGELSPRGEWHYRPSDLVLLDEVPPRALKDRATLPGQVVRLDRALP